MLHGLRLTPTSASRRVLTLEFIRRYFVEYGASPSFGEIAAALGVPVQRVSGLVRELEREGSVLRTPGEHRGLRLPDAADEMAESQALLVLRRRGWEWDADRQALQRATVSNPQLTGKSSRDDMSSGARGERA